MEKRRVHIAVTGIVQGVGFRPFIHKQITDHSLLGWIRNTSEGAELELEGSAERIERFLAELFTPSECVELSKRWALMRELLAGKSQRAIARELGLSLCKITRGAKYARDEDSLFRRAVLGSRRG